MTTFLPPEIDPVTAGLLDINPLGPLVDAMDRKINPPKIGDIQNWVPFPKQAEATRLASEVDELLYGGAAGPGKTEWLMRYGIEQMELYPGNRGVIFRRVFPSLRRSIIPRLQAILAGDRAKWNENSKTFTFPNGSILEIASLQYDHTIHEFQGAEYGWIGFEELTEFSLIQYEYLITRARVPATAPDDAGIRPHVCSTTNPGGFGHKWVKRRFVSPKPEDLELGDRKPNPLKPWRPRFDPLVHSPDVLPLLRVYIPATYKDNPALLKKDPTYLSKLRAQSTVGMRRALEEGDWDALDAIEGALWSMESIEAGRIAKTFHHNTTVIQQRVVAVDPSDGDEGGDAYGVAVCARGADGIGYVEESHEWTNLSPRKLAQMTLKLRDRVQADVVVIEKNHGGKWLVAVFEQEDPYGNFKTVWASDKKQTRAEPVSALFEFVKDVKPQVRAKIVGHQPALEDELTMTSFTSGEPSPNLLDAVVWGLSWLMLNKGIVKDATEMDDQRAAGRR